MFIGPGRAIIEHQGGRRSWTNVAIGASTVLAVEE